MAGDKARVMLEGALLAVAVGGAVVVGVVGVGILAAFLVTRDPWYGSVGLVWLLVGGAVTTLALIAGLGYGFLNERRGGRRGVAWLARVAPILNLPLAAACVMIGSAEYFKTGFTVVNTGTSVIDAARVVPPAGTPVELGPILPGAAVRRRFVAEGEGAVGLVIEQGGVTREAVLIGYTTSNLPHRPVRAEVGDSGIVVTGGR